MTLTPEKLDEIEQLAGLATPGPYSCVNGETIALRAPDGSRLAQMTFLTKRGRRDADEVAKTARMLAALDPATVRELVRLARIGERHETRPDPLGDAMNSGDGVYRP